MILMCSAVEMEDVKGGESVTVLISIDNHTDLVKEDLCIHFGRFLRHGLVDDDLVRRSI